MPRPKNYLVRSYFEKQSDKQVICRNEKCEKLLMLHAGNLERHLKTFHSNMYESYAKQKVEFGEVEGNELNNELDNYDSESEKSIVPPFRKRQKLKSGFSKRSKHCNGYSQILANAWASEYRLSSADQQLFAKKAIDEILFEARMGTLHRNSVKINQPSGGQYNNTEIVYGNPNPNCMPHGTYNQEFKETTIEIEEDNKDNILFSRMQ